MSENDTDRQERGADKGQEEADRGTFADLGLRAEVLQALQDMGFSAPMEVQRQTVPVVQSGRDALVQSRTGSGKTAAFGIPLVDRVVDPDEKAVQAIVLLPTRELALQVAAEMARIAAHRPMTVVPVYGGAPMGKQVEQLRAGGQIVCGTPGRILDHLRRGTLKLDRVRCAVLDECDEMLSMGFQEDIERILEHTPSERQTMLFSATLPEGIKRLARRYLRTPVHLKLSADFVGVAEISHLYYTVSGANRESDLLRILAFENPGRGIVFCNTREETGRVAEFLRSKGMEAEAISSDLSQSDREKVMKQMREGSIRFLVATDVAARGIDIDDISHVFNFSFPDSPESYIHRTGRTGRAGRHGVAVSLIGPTEVGSFYYLKLLYKIKPEERTLPSEAEIQARREGESLQRLRKDLAPEPGLSWRALARRVLTALDAEHLLASLLKERLSHTRNRPSAAEAVADNMAQSTPEAESEALGFATSLDEPTPRREGEGRRERFSDRGRDEAGRYGDRERGRNASGRRPEGRGERDRPRPGDRLRRGDRVRRDREPGYGDKETLVSETPMASRGDRPAEEMSPPPIPPVEAAPLSVREGRDIRASDDFMSVWNEDGEESPRQAQEPVQERTRTRAPSRSEARADEIRLYLNLGRKDRVRADDVASLLQDAGHAVPSSDIEVMNTHSYINVPSGQSEALVLALNGREHNGRALVCEPAKPRR